MAETKTEKGLQFRHVSLHGNGKTEHGTLSLMKHHLLFTYYPESEISRDTLVQDGTSRATNHVTASAESSTLTEASAHSDQSQLSNDISKSVGLSVSDKRKEPSGTANEDTMRSKGKDDRQRPRPKERWVPYPLINSCVLRPSHASVPTIRNRTSEVQVDSTKDNDELFPPTFGTSTYERPSTESARLGPYSSPARPASPVSITGESISGESGRQPAIRIRLKDFRMLALHFHSGQSGVSPDETARQVFLQLRTLCCVDDVSQLHAFHYRPHKDEIAAAAGFDYDARREFARMGISGKAANGPGTAWRITDINRDYSYSATYPSVLCVPQSVSDNTLKYGGPFRSRARIPCLAYLHSNGGSITRSSQPLVGFGKRNAQDERLVSSVFASHTPPMQTPEGSPPQIANLTSPSDATLESSSSDPATLESDIPSLRINQSETGVNGDPDANSPPARRKVYGSTRRNLIVDARPRINAEANRATGGGYEDVSKYMGNGGMPVELVFLNIQNIHKMRDSLDEVIESMANSDYIKMKPNQERLRKSGWLSHISGMLDGADMVARVVGLGGSHVLIHCSDGWDRTAQISALSQVMLDPHYRTLGGFKTLVQKDFLSFGHKFRDRNGIQGSEKWFEIENERIAPSRPRENNAAVSKALTGAQNWLEKKRGSLFRQQNNSGENVAERISSRPPSPPPGLVHSPPSATGKEEKVRRMKEDEVSPIFHQFLDGVFQLQHQNPNAFEFNERFLRRLLYHTYSCQYGEFLFDNEKQRMEHKDKVPSVWTYFLFRKQEFINPNYVAKVDETLLFPDRQGPERRVDVKWWSGLFGREDQEMNLPRALAPADIPVPTPTIESNTSADGSRTHWSQATDDTFASSSAIKEAKSTPALSSMRNSISSSFSTLSLRGNKTAQNGETAHPSVSEFEVVSNNEESASASTASEQVSTDDQEASEPVVEEYDGDPLGVTSKSLKQPEKSGLDFSAFASQNAFRDR